MRAQVRSHAHTYGAASPEPGYLNHVYSSFRLPFFKSITKLHFVSKIFLGYFGTRLSHSADAKRGALRHAQSRGDQQVLVAEGCSYAAAFKLAKRHDKHFLYCSKYYSISPCITKSQSIANLPSIIFFVVAVGRGASVWRQAMAVNIAKVKTIIMLRWQQMASFGVHRERLDDLPQQRGTREKQSLGDGAHLRRDQRR